jgi:YVTN family beta-propeller protein
MSHTKGVPDPFGRKHRIAAVAAASACQARGERFKPAKDSRYRVDMTRFSFVTTVVSTVALAIGLSACERPSTPAQPAQPAAPGAPATAPPATRGPRVYVSDETGGLVALLDPERREVVRKINVGKRPRGIRVSPDGTKLYVALSGSPIGGPNVDESKLPPADRAADGIGVIDLATGTVVRKYQSGSDPESFSISADGRMLFVSNEDAGEMTALDLESGTVKARVKVGEEPEGVSTSPDGRLVFVSCEGTNEVVVVDTASLKVVGRVATGPRPRSVEFSRDGRIGFVANENGASMTVFEVATRKVIKTLTLPRPQEPDAIPPRPMGQQISPDGLQLFVSLGRAKSIAVIDLEAQAVSRILEDVGMRPWGIGISPDGRTLYTANGPSGDVSIVEVGTGRTAARVAIGGSPWGIAVAAAR